MRLVASVMTGFFLWCCWLQTNDPDPLIWIAVYGYAAAVTFAVAGGKNPIVPASLGFAAYTIAVLWHAPHMRTGWWRAEEGREAMGLLICACWMLVLGILLHRRFPAPKPHLCHQSQSGDRA